MFNLMATVTIIDGDKTKKLSIQPIMLKTVPAFFGKAYSQIIISNLGFIFHYAHTSMAIILYAALYFQVNPKPLIYDRILS